MKQNPQKYKIDTKKYGSCDICEKPASPLNRTCDRCFKKWVA